MNEQDQFLLEVERNHEQKMAKARLERERLCQLLNERGKNWSIILTQWQFEKSQVEAHYA
jgi:hypothetical protein